MPRSRGCAPCGRSAWYSRYCRSRRSRTCRATCTWSVLLEAGRPLFLERDETFGRVWFGGGVTVDEGDFGLQPLLVIEFERHVGEPLRAGETDGTLARQLGGQGPGGGEEVGVGHDTGNQAPAFCRFGVEQVARQHQMLGAQQTDRARQALRSAGAGQLTEIDMPVTDPGRGAGDRHVASQQQFDPARDGRAVDRRDPDRARLFDAAQHVVEIVEERLEAIRFPIEPQISFQIATGGKATSFAGQDDETRSGRLDLRHRRSQFLDGRPVERVHLVSTRQRDLREIALDRHPDIVVVHASTAHRRLASSASAALATLPPEERGSSSIVTRYSGNHSRVTPRSTTLPGTSPNTASG